jgi:hypothetical protein
MNPRDLLTTDVETIHPEDETSEVLTRLARVDFKASPSWSDRRLGLVTGKRW